MIQRALDRTYHLTKKLGDRIGLDLPYFVKGGFWLGLAQGFEMLKGLILSIAFTRLLPKEVFGQYQFVLSVLGVVSIFALPGMGVAVTQAVARGYDGTYWRALKTIFKWSWLGSLALIGVAIYAHLTARPEGASVFLILAAAFPFYSISGYYAHLLTSKGLFKIKTILELIFVISSILVTLLILFYLPSLFWLVLTVILIQTLINGYFSVFFVRRFIQNRKHDPKVFTYGRQMTFANIIKLVSCQADSLLLGIFLGFTDLAIYSIALVIPYTLFSSSEVILKNAFFFKLNKINISENLSEFWKRFWQLFLLGFCIGFIYFLISPYFFKYLYPDYLESSLFYSRFYGIIFLTLPIFLINSDFLIHKKSKNTILSQIISSLIYLISLPILLFYSGIFGAVIARLLMRFSALFTSLFLFIKDSSTTQK